MARDDLRHASTALCALRFGEGGRLDSLPPFLPVVEFSLGDARVGHYVHALVPYLGRARGDLETFRRKGVALQRRVMDRQQHVKPGPKHWSAVKGCRVKRYGGKGQKIYCSTMYLYSDVSRAALKGGSDGKKHAISRKVSERVGREETRQVKESSGEREREKGGEGGEAVGIAPG